MLGYHRMRGQQLLSIWLLNPSHLPDLPMGMESITGYSIISAESLDDAEKIAQENPFIASIRVYEIMTQ